MPNLILSFNGLMITFDEDFFLSTEIESDNLLMSSEDDFLLDNVGNFLEVLPASPTLGADTFNIVGGGI